MLEYNGGSISSENMSSTSHAGEEFPNQSTPKASRIEDSKTSGSGSDGGDNDEKTREAIEAARTNSFANISNLNPAVDVSKVNVEHAPQVDDHHARDSVEHATTNKPPTFNLVDEYFQAKDNKLDKPAAQIVINLEKGVYFLVSQITLELDLLTNLPTNTKKISMASRSPIKKRTRTTTTSA